MTQEQSKRAAYFHRSALKIANEAQENFERGQFDRVIRKSQEAVELLFKSKLLQKGREPAKTHDLRDLQQALGESLSVNALDLVFLSEERIPSFYAGMDFIPDEEYTREDAERCLNVLRTLSLVG